MADFFIGNVPDVLWHGSVNHLEAGMVCKPARDCAWWREMPWEAYDDDVEGEWRTAYANLVWEHLGLRSPESGEVPEWASNIATIEELGEAVSIMFVTDDREKAEERYGPAHAIDMTSEDILDVVPDPNVTIYNAWVIVMRAGSPLPLLGTPAPAP